MKIIGNVNTVITQNSTCIVCDNYVEINGVRLPPAPGKGNNITTINDKVYINGYEYKKGKWRKTLPALWHLYF